MYYICTYMYCMYVCMYHTYIENSQSDNLIVMTWGIVKFERYKYHILYTHVCKAIPRHCVGA